MSQCTSSAECWRREKVTAFAAATLWAMACVPVALGQGVLTPPPTDYSGISQAARTIATNGPSSVLFAAPPETVTPEKPLLQWGPIEFHPHLLYRFLYGDGIQAAPGEQRKTAINQIYPGVLLRLGDHWTLDYTPTLSYYSSRSFRDTLDHAVTLAGFTTWEDWAFGLSQGYATSSQPLVETGAQTDSETYSTALTAVYRMSSATSLELGANQDFRFNGEQQAGVPLMDTRSWSTMEWLNFQFTPTLGAAAGGGFGYDEVSVGSDMTHESVQGRVSWAAGQKLSFMLTGGAEIRQFLSSGASDMVTPIFAASAHYQLFESTSLSLTASRVVAPSYFADEVTEATSVSAGLRQRLLQKFYLEVSGGYSKTAYSSTTSGLRVNREDDGAFATVRLSAAFLKRGTAGVFYTYTENTSNQAGFGYSSSQVGLELGYRL